MDPEDVILEDLPFTVQIQVIDLLVLFDLELDPLVDHIIKTFFLVLKLKLNYRSLIITNAIQ